MNAERLLAHYEKIADAPDAIARLRRFILDLAVRGKLVAQNAKDEPASELLKRIAKKKAQLVKAGEIKKDKPLPPVDEDAEFDVPQTWLWTRLGVVTSYIQRGKSPKYAVADGSLVVSQKCVQWSGLDLSVAKQVTLESLANYEDIRFLRDGDLLWNSTGTGTIGRVVRLICPPDKLVCDSHVTVVRRVEVDPEYIRTWLRSDHVYALIEDRAAGSTNQVELTAQMAINQVVPLPPLAEQHRIVAKVDELMGLCDRLEAARASREAVRDRLGAASLARLNDPDPENFQADARLALDALPALTTRPDQITQIRHTILNLAVRGKLVPQDPQDDPAVVQRAFVAPETNGRLHAEIPPSWRWVRVEDVAEARLGKMLDKAKNKGRPYPYLRNTNVHWFDIRLNDLKTILLDDAEFEEYRLKSGDVLICEGGHGIGRTAVWRGGPQNLVFQKALHRVRPGGHLESSFFAQCCFVYFDAGIMQTYFTGVGIPHFTGRALAKLVFPLPPIAEQHRIVAKVDELMTLCDRLEASLAKADHTRRRLLDALLAEALTPTDDRKLEAAE